MSNYSYLLKYIIIGDASVGKSCILMQFLEGKFKVDSETTVGVEFGSKIITIGEDRLKLQIWDTAGQEIFKSITRSYYRGSIGAILMYDITSRQSFANVGKWIDETQNYANEKLTIMLVGNKNDLENKREVTKEEGQKFADNHKMLFLECSAKEMGLTETVFFDLAKEIIRKISAGEIDPKNETLGVKVGTYRNIVEQRSEKLSKKTCC